ncbi:MAG: hypothetical protein ABL958_19180 [Bdellovibrionia bacterium]
MKFLAVFSIFCFAWPALAQTPSSAHVNSLLKYRLGISDGRWEITGADSKGKPCSIVVNLESGQISFYKGDDEDDDGLTYKFLGNDGASIVDNARTDENGLYLHSRKDAGDVGNAEFEFTLSLEKVASVKVGANIKGILGFGGKFGDQRSCHLISEPRSVPTFKSIWKRFRGK